MRDYARRVLARDNLKIGVVGDIDAETAGRLIDRTFGKLPAKAQLKPVPDAKMQGLGGRTVVDLNVPQAVVTFGGPGIARNDPDFMAAYIVNHILGGGSFSSRLYREVREVRGLAYGVNTSLTWFEHAAVLIGGTATRADATGETIDVIEARIPPHGGGRPDRGRVRQGEDLSQGLVRAQSRHLHQDRVAARADADRQSRHRLYRPPLRDDRRGDAGGRPPRRQAAARAAACWSPSSAGRRA